MLGHEARPISSYGGYCFQDQLKARKGEAEVEQMITTERCTERTQLWRASLMLALSIAVPVVAVAQSPLPPDLTNASLEDLLNTQVTSVSKKDQALLKAAAAVFVISQEDIRHSGAVNIPDLLRMVPGLNIARVDANTWAISVRGFNTRYSDKVLVLIDGRSVYTPSFSGVYWDQQDVPLEDIERIEVIRGPGGTVWGANAMNGVINIITKSSKTTLGGLVTAGTGTEESAESLIQYGGRIGDAGTYRAFGRYSNTESSPLTAGDNGADAWHNFHGGFRSDWALSPNDSLTVQGDLYQSRAGQTLTTVLSSQLPTTATFNDRISVDSGNFLGRWNHTLANGSDFSLQVYYDRFNRLDEAVDEKLSTVDIDFQHHFKIAERHDIVWGGDFRRFSDDLRSGYDVTFTPPKKSDSLYSGFFQDEITLTKSLSFTIGSKVEHNDYSGFDFEPSAQLLWTPTGRQAIWFSASQAVRQPSRMDSAINYDIATIPLEGNSFGVLTLLGNPRTQAEQLRDYEVGYRVQAGKRLSVDVTAFRSYYHNLETSEPGDPFRVDTPGPTHYIFPLFVGNLARARTYGGEIFANWDVTGRWRISPGVSFLQMNVIKDPASQDSTVQGTTGDTPEHQFEIRSFVKLRRNLDWDTSIYFVGRLAEDLVPAYTRVDTRLGWRIGKSIELSLVGQNLLTPRHAEFGDAFEVNRTLVERSALVKATWRF
jgi:iron complex outermembrane recepter protein